MALLVGVSTAVAIGGAVDRNALPQVGGTINLFDLHSTASVSQVGSNDIQRHVDLAGVITTLVYFHFVRAQQAMVQFAA